MDPIWIGLITFAALLLILFLGVHVAVAMGIIGIIGIMWLTSFHGALDLTARVMFANASIYDFTVIPLFIVMGEFAALSGITINAYNFGSKWLSSIPAGMYMVTVTSCALFAAACGSSAATTIAVGKVVLPEMKKHGYDKSLSLGTIAACGTLGILIPPSTIFVMYGIVTEEPIGQLLIAGILPGIVSAIIYMIGLSIMIWRKPSLGPPGSPVTWKERFATVPPMWSLVLLFAIIVGGIYGGVFTPSEAGAWGAFVAVLLAVMKTGRNFLREAKPVVLGMMPVVAMIFFLIMSGMVFARFLVLANVIDAMVQWVVGGGYSPVVILILFIIICMVLGMFTSAMILVIVIAPIMHSILVPLGYNGIWLGVIMIKLFELAMITPPIAGNVFVAKGLDPEASLSDVFRGVMPFVVMETLTIVILVIFPQISIWLPSRAFS